MWSVVKLVKLIVELVATVKTLILVALNRLIS